MRPKPSVDWTDVLCVILRGAPPRLPGALCVRYPPRLFDGTDDRSVALALRICQRCPAQPQCRAWAAKHPGAISGVVGGDLRPPQ
jgi:hypothetical protein